MGQSRREPPTTVPATGPGGVTSTSTLSRVRHLKIVPLDPTRSAAPSPSEPDWPALMRRIAEHQDREAFGRVFAHFAPQRDGDDDLVKTRRDAQTIYYSLSNPNVASLIALLYEFYCKAGCEPTALN